MPRLPYVLASLIAASPLLLGGCGGAGGSNNATSTTQAGSSPSADAPKGQQPAETPASGNRVDLSKAGDIVKNEVRGGESDAGPTPIEYLWKQSDPKAIRDEPYELVVPAGLPPVAAVIPAHNPMTKGKVELGKQLYFDPRVSKDATVSCASCHDPAKGWTDNLRTSIGIGNQKGGRNAPTVLNTVYGRSMFWDGRAPSLEGQAQGPIQNKIEMGDQSYKEIIERLRTIPGYKDQFLQVFGTDVTLDGMAKAIAAFERTALSGGSAYDKYFTGDPDEPATFTALTESEKRGMALFGYPLRDEDPYKVDASIVKKANCTKCHVGQNFTDEEFHNIGVGFDESKAKFADLGRWVISPIGAKADSERGSFKTPTVRDITRTAPYMHDGTEKTLEAVVEYYNKGGNKNPTLDPEMKPLNLTDGEKADLVAFMKALTSPPVVVAHPTLPPGPDGKTIDPARALNMSTPAKPVAGLDPLHQTLAAGN